MIRLSKIDGELSLLKENKVVIFGAGALGIYTKKLLDYLNIDVYYYCDNDNSKWGTTLNGVSIISMDKLKKIYDDSTVILIAVNDKVAKIIKKQLVDNEIHNYVLFP